MGGEEYAKMRLEVLSEEYGIFNGELTIPNYNREERRKYIREHKKDKKATICPHCNNKTIKITDDNGKEFCELCGKKVEWLEVDSIGC